MGESEARFDVRVLHVPATTPQGEPFAPALARSFGIPLATAERLAKAAPAYVKRGIAADVAGGMRRKLVELGAKVEVVESAPPRAPSSAAPAASPGSYSIVPGSVAVAVGVGTPVPVSVAPRPSASEPPRAATDLARAASEPPLPAAELPSASEPPVAAAEPLIAGFHSAPPPPAFGSDPPPGLDAGPSIDLATALPKAPGTSASTPPKPPPSLAPPTPSRAPLPPPEKGFSIHPLFLVASALLLVGFGWVLVAKLIMRSGDVQMLGNTPESETWCVNEYCLTGRETGARYAGKRVLMVAWRTGCLEEQEYLAYLEGLAAKHREDLTVVGVALATPAKRAAKGLPAALSQPPPETFPPDGCSPAFDVLAPDQGYVADRIQPPITYLLDERGKLVATWRGGMSPEQRERLSTWLDGKAWEPH